MLKTQEELIEDIYQALIDAANKVNNTAVQGDHELWTQKFRELRWDLINALHEMRRRVDQDFRVKSWDKSGD